MANFKQKAKDAIVLSDLMNGRTKLSTDEIISKFPQGFTISDFDIINDGKSEYPVFTVKEDSGICFFGGAILNSMVTAWCEGYESLEKCREDFRAEGGVPIKLYTGRTKSGNNLTKVEIL